MLTIVQLAMAILGACAYSADDHLYPVLDQAIVQRARGWECNGDQRNLGLIYTHIYIYIIINIEIDICMCYLPRSYTCRACSDFSHDWLPQTHDFPPDAIALLDMNGVDVTRWKRLQQFQDWDQSLFDLFARKGF